MSYGTDVASRLPQAGVMSGQILIGHEARRPVSVECCSRPNSSLLGARYRRAADATRARPRGDRMKAASSLWNVWARLRQLVSRIRDNSESRRAAGFVDELGARAAALENDLALMKGGEFRAMTDANDGRVCELPRQESHHTILAA